MLPWLPGPPWLKIVIPVIGETLKCFTYLKWLRNYSKKSVKSEECFTNIATIWWVACCFPKLLIICSILTRCFYCLFGLSFPSLHVCFYPIPLPWAGYETRSKRWFEFKVFLFFDCLTIAKEPSLLYYLPIAGEENRWIYVFFKDISTNWNANSLI